MKDTHVKEQLSAYLDNMLAADETKRVEVHLKDCAECTKVFSELKNMVSWLKSFPKPAPNVGLEARLMARLKNKQATKRSFHFSWVSVSGGLATAMVALFVFVMVRENRLDKQACNLLRQEEAPMMTDGYLAEKSKSDQGISIGSGVGFGGGAGMAHKAASPQAVVVQGKAKETFADKIVARDANVVAGNKDAREAFAPSKPSLKSELASAPQPAELAAMGEEKANVIRRGAAAPIHVEESELEREEIQWKAGRARAKKQEEKLGLRDSDDASQSERMGFICDIKKPEQHVVRSKKDWESLLKRMGNQIPVPLFPPLNFSKKMVVAVFMGEQPSAGYTIRVVSAEIRDEAQGKVLIVKTRKTSPPKDAGVAAVLTQPYHMKVLPQFPGPIQFQDVK